MKFLSKQDLIDLGFKRKNISAEESGDEPYHYYEYSFGIYSMVILASSYRPLDDGMYIAKILDYDNFIFDDKDTLKEFIDLLNKVNIKK
jgi:hypothetical protein